MFSQLPLPACRRATSSRAAAASAGCLPVYRLGSMAGFFAAAAPKAAPSTKAAVTAATAVLLAVIDGMGMVRSSWYTTHASSWPAQRRRLPAAPMQDLPRLFEPHPARPSHPHGPAPPT